MSADSSAAASGAASAASGAKSGATSAASGANPVLRQLPAKSGVSSAAPAAKSGASSATAVHLLPIWLIKWCRFCSLSLVLVAWQPLLVFVVVSEA